MDSFFANPDPTVFLIADPDQALKLCKILPYDEFSIVKKRLQKSRNPWSW